MQTTYKPGSGTEPKQVDQPGIETGLVISGRLDMWIEGEHYVLAEGDSYSVQLSESFYSRNTSTKDDTVLVWTVTYVK